MGKLIFVTIKDSDFLDDVEGQLEQFRKGDVLECEMVFSEEWYNASQGYIPRSYEVAKVLSHEVTPVQLTIAL